MLNANASKWLRKPTSIVMSGVVLAGVVLIPMTVASAMGSGDDMKLRYSYETDRRPSEALDGATIQGNVAVFLRANALVSKVEFFIDDPSMSAAPYRVERVAPFDVGSTAADGSAVLIDTGSEHNGEHTLTARVTRMRHHDHSNVVVHSATFTIGTKTDDGSTTTSTTVATSPTTHVTTTTVAPTSTTSPATTVPVTVVTTTTKPDVTTTTKPVTTTTKVPVTTTTRATTTTTTTRPPATTVPGTNPTTGHFSTLPVGATLPTEAQCAAAVRPAAEVRPTNAPFNNTKGNSPNDEVARITGNFTGTTDELIQWTACKWGIDEDIVRAQMAKESWWDMKAVGDVDSGHPSYGIGQVREYYHPTAFENNNARASTAYNLDYTYARWRVCYDGTQNGADNGFHFWLDGYNPGDVWGCVGLWFSGRWHDDGANTYIAAVQDYLNQRIWTTQGFLGYVSTL